MNGTLVKNMTVRQQEIVESARRIISAYGMERLTIREIAGDLGLTDGALYRHFKSKKEIIGLLIEDIENTLLSAIDSAAKGVDDPQKKLENILSSHLSYAEQRKGVSFIVISETLNLHDKTLQNKMFNVIEKYLKRIEGILEEGVQSGEFRENIDIASAGIGFFGMVQSSVTFWALSGYKYPLRNARIRGLFDVYKNGISKRGNNLA